MSSSSRLLGFLPRETRFWHKIAAVCLVFFIPLGVLLYLYVGEKNKAIAFARKELVGTEYLRPCRHLMEQVIRHRTAVRELPNGDGGVTAEVSRVSAAIDRELRTLEQLDAKNGAALSQDDRKTGEFLATLKEQWQGVRGATGKSGAAEDGHQKMIGTLRQLIGLVGDTSNLILDPDLDSYYLMDSVLLKLPDSQDQIQSLADFNEKILARKTLTPAERTELVVRQGLLKSSVEATNSPLSGLRVSMKAVNDSTPGKTLNETLDPVLTNFVAVTDGYLADVKRRVTEPAQPQMTATENARATTAALEANFALWDEATKQLDGLLTKRAGEFAGAKWTALAIAGGAVLLAILLAALITRGVGRQIRAMTQLFAEFQAGNFQARAKVLTNDELGRMAVILNDNILPLVQSRDERDMIQESIMKLLEDVGGVANGDLTKEAEVTADVTGAIADSFNMMINDLRKLVGRVKNAAMQVTQSAGQINQTADHLVRGTESQSNQIIQTSAAIDEMAVSIQQVSDNAAVSTEVAQQSLKTAKNGIAAVGNTIEGMDRIRDQVQETAKRIKRLGESSQEIGQAIQLIDDIAERTSILALNASIQAAMAGEAGRGFAVVAEEVERLAVRSSDATKKIASLVKSIQGETTEAVGAMEKSIQEVVEGSRRANQAGTALGEIEDVSAKLADLIQAISLASRQQARGSEALAKSMTDISHITQQTAAGTKQTATSVIDLTALARRLSESVSAFRLPGAATNGHAIDGEIDNGAVNRLSGHFKRPAARN